MQIDPCRCHVFSLQNPHQGIVYGAFISYSKPVAPVVQVVKLEFYLCLSAGFEPQVGRTFDFICKN